MQRFSRHMHFVLHLIIPIQVIAKINNLHRCLRKLGESDCTQRFLLLPLWAQPCYSAVCYSETPIVGGNLGSVIRGLQISKNSIPYFFSCPVCCTHNQCRKEELVLKTHINSEKHRHVPNTQCMYKSALQEPTVLQEDCVKYYVCSICQKKHTHSPH